MTGEVELKDERDLGFAKIAQGALVNGTLLPSGYLTPPHDMVIQGTKLVPISRDEWLAKHAARP